MTQPASANPSWRLKPIGKYGLPATINLSEAGLSLGRDASNNCVICGGRWSMVSRLHARLEFDGAKLVVHDLGSSNGTFVNSNRVDYAELSPADVLQLGPEGPRFVVFHEGGVEVTSIGETRAVPGRAIAAPSSLSLGQTALISLKRALGLEAAEASASRVEARQKKYFALGGATLCILASAGVVAFSWLEHDGQELVARVARNSEARSNAVEHESARRADEAARHNAELHEQTEELASRLDAGLLRVGGELERRIADSYVARETWDLERAGLEAQRQAIEARLAQLSASQGGSNDELEQLRKRLELTNTNLSQYNPREIEAEKLALVKHVREAVVMIEARVVFREQETQRLLHLTQKSLGASEVNLRDEGDVLDQRSSGSGFVISSQGYILTNAHVAVPAEFRDSMDITESNQVLPEVELAVVFSGSSRRLPAHLIQIDDEEDHDFALIKIEPFEGMPLLELDDLDSPPPAAGTEVYLCGFPLGTFAVQEGDRVIASTLKGILSRRVGPYVQIDAGVHPGISGGPVTDANGKVIGVVCSVQATPLGEIAATIGYALPIGSARRVLPSEAMR
ncbi:MAG: trypsin-like peptidase domain-containing protein [Planctomycetota bacterium]